MLTYQDGDGECEKFVDAGPSPHSPARPAQMGQVEAGGGRKLGHNFHTARNKNQ